MRLDKREHIRSYLVQIHLALLPGGRMGIDQNFVGQALQPLDLAERFFHQLSDFRLGGGAVVQVVQEQAHPGQGIADLVSDAGPETAQGSQAFQLLDLVIQLLLFGKVFDDDDAVMGQAVLLDQGGFDIQVFQSLALLQFHIIIAVGSLGKKHRFHIIDQRQGFLGKAGRITGGRHRFRATQYLAGGLIDAGDPPVMVDSDHPVLHVADDIFHKIALIDHLLIEPGVLDYPRGLIGQNLQRIDIGFGDRLIGAHLVRPQDADDLLFHLQRHIDKRTVPGQLPDLAVEVGGLGIAVEILHEDNSPFFNDPGLDAIEALQVEAGALGSDFILRSKSAGLRTFQVFLPLVDQVKDRPVETDAVDTIFQDQTDDGLHVEGGAENIADALNAFQDGNLIFQLCSISLGLLL